MYKGYDELQELDPEEYLNWRSFDTPFDTVKGGEEQYKKGYEQGKELPDIFISCNGVWGASGKNVMVSSYEGIGYHANTSSLLRGFLDSPAKITIYRREGKRETVIKEMDTNFEYPEKIY